MPQDLHGAVETAGFWKGNYRAIQHAEEILGVRQYEPRTTNIGTSGRDPRYDLVGKRLASLMAEGREILENDLTTPRIVRKYNEHEGQRIKQLRNVQERPLCLVDPDHGRLMKGANHKRGYTFVDLNDLRKLQPSVRECNTTSELSRHGQDRVDESKENGYERGRSLSPPAHYAQFEVGHAASEMSGKSPGKERKRKQHSTSAKPTTFDSPADGPTSSYTLDKEEQEIADSQESYENEGDVVDSKRIKRDTGANSKQHTTEADAVKSAKDEPTNYAHDNARDSRDSQGNKDTPKKRKSWGELVLERYNSTASSLPDYGPKDQPSAVAKPAATSKMPGVLGGGFKPRNDLSKDPYNTSNPVFVLPRPKFDLHQDEYPRRSDPHPNKKQKTQDGSIPRGQVHREVIELEAGPSDKRYTPSARSGNSHAQNWPPKSNGSRSANPVPELRNVEDMMRGNKTRRRTSGTLNAQLSKHGGLQQETRYDTSKITVFKHGTIMNRHNREDPKDPIIDVDMTIPEALYSTHPEVVIKQPYRGTVHLQPTREPNDRGSRSSTTARNQTNLASPYFAANENGRKRRSSSISNSVVEVLQNTSGPSTKQQNAGSIQKMSAFTFPKGQAGSDVSEDELGMDDKSHRETAQKLLRKRQKTNGSSTLAQMDLHRDSDSYTSNDESGKADMIRTNLPKNGKPKKQRGEDRFNVLQIFCEAYAWLPGGSIKPWSLLQNCEAGVLTVFDDEGSAVKDLILTPNQITKIVRSTDDGKLILFKAVDQTAKSARQIYLELQDSDQRDQFCENMKAVLPNVGMMVPKTGDNLDKAFEYIQKKIKPPTMKRAQPQDFQDQDEANFVTEKSQARVSKQFDNAQAKKPVRSQGMKDQMGKEDEDSRSGNPTSISQRTRFSKTFGAHSEEFPREFTVPELDADTFYGGNNRTAEISNPYATRLRNPGREPGPRQPPKPRSPSPERWTELNTGWEKKWRNSIIYPREGKNKATVDKQDIERLDEGQFLNDNLIMFYLLWLEQDLARRRPDLSKRVYFHNTFFYERLSKPVKGKKGINYEAVERWTSKVDLLSYDYIIVPVNEHTHWYVAIICNAPKLLDSEPEVIEVSQSQGVSPDARKDRSDLEAQNKSSPTSPPKPPPAGLSETGVGESMKKMSLTDEARANGAEQEWPDDNPRKDTSVQTTLQQGDIGASDGRVIKESLAQEPATIPVEEALKVAVPAKRGKRKSSTPAPRKYDPKEPRIITLDSLSLPHSPTCTNLKDYLIAEIKAKRGIEIPQPRALGMTATNIPTQKNYCDCGLFLLSYIEQFLRYPDQFTEDLLQRADMEIEYELRKAPEMRNHIRKLLFDLQAQQMAEEESAEKVKKAKGRGKKTSKAQDNDDVSTPAETGSRGRSKSARPEVDPVCSNSNRSSTQRELVDTNIAQECSKHSPQRERATRESTSEHLAESERYEHVKRVLTPEQEPEPELFDPQPASQEAVDLEDGVGDDVHMHNSNEQPRGIISRLSSILKPFPRLDNVAENSDTIRPGESRTNAVEIEDDSPHKVNHDAQRVLDPDSPSTQLQRDFKSSSPEPPEQRPSHRRRKSTPYPEQAGLTSPDPDETEDWNGIAQTPTRNDSPPVDSSPPQSPPKPTPVVVDITGDEELAEDDGEMLFQSGPKPQPDPQSDLRSESYSGAELLGSSKPSTPTKPSVKKQPSTFPKRGSSRKVTPRKASHKSKGVSNTVHKPEVMEGRDALDRAIIGAWHGKHKRFSPE